MVYCSCFWLKGCKCFKCIVASVITVTKKNLHILFVWLFQIEKKSKWKKRRDRNISEWFRLTATWFLACPLDKQDPTVELHRAHSIEIYSDTCLEVCSSNKQQLLFCRVSSKTLILWYGEVITGGYLHCPCITQWQEHARVRWRARVGILVGLLVVLWCTVTGFTFYCT